MLLALAAGMHSSHRSPRRTRRGVTLIEVGAIAALVTLVASGVTLWVKPKLDSQRTESATKDAQVIRDAVVEWQSDNRSGCPTISRLELDKVLPASSRTDDPWGNRYRVSCYDNSATVISAGPDHLPGTSDDVRVPHG